MTRSYVGIPTCYSCFLLQALEKTIASMQSVLNRTLSSAKIAAKGNAPNPRQLELKLIQSREEILEPKVTIKAKAFSN